MLLTKDTHPAIIAARRLIEEDNGGHLIGTVYPGEPIDLDQLDVPEAFEPWVAAAEAGLARLLADSAEDFETFVVGEESEQHELRLRRRDLTAAHLLLWRYFEDWAPLADNEAGAPSLPC